MYHVLTFLAYTIIFWIANVCLVQVLYILIQPGQLLGGWQHTLNRMHDANSKVLNSLAKPLGDCEICFSHLVTMCIFIYYVFFMKFIIRIWVTDNISSMMGSIIINCGWYLVYGCVGTILSLKLLMSSNK